MASTIDAAFAGVNRALLEPVNTCSLIRHPPPHPNTGTTVEVRRLVKAVTGILMTTTPVSFDEAYEAVFDAFVLLGERNGPGFWEEPVMDWHPLLVFWAKLAIKRRRAERRRGELILGRAVELGANAEKALEPEGEKQRIRTVDPVQRKPGGPWGRGEIVHAFVEFERKHGRPPKARDLDKSKLEANGTKALPGKTEVRREFGGLVAAREAAGQVGGTKGNGHRWTRRALAETLAAWAGRAGHWPDSEELDLRRELPGSKVCRKHFGTTAVGKLQAAVETELADPTTKN